MDYYLADDVAALTKKIIKILDFRHIDISRLGFIRSKGTKSKNIQARIHTIGKIWFTSFNISPLYTIEVISEIYDRLTQDEKEQVIIHELLHIPRGFSGGFVQHRKRITYLKVRKFFKKYKEYEK